MIKKDKLQDYQKKRNFRHSPEPSATEKAKTKKGKMPIFVIQEHHASHLHYDFRLEIDRVLASWAIPKGPSTKPKEKRLAVETEDHPLAYAKFEGTIPEGEYGAGEVLIWDKGKYENQRDISMAKAKKEGKIEIFLHGKKITGSYALIRMDTSKKPKWLLIKRTD